MVSNFINGIINKMNIDCVANVEEKEDAFYVNLTGEDTGVLIGYRGDVLDSLQYLSLLIVNKDNPENKRLSTAKTTEKKEWSHSPNSQRKLLLELQNLTKPNRSSL